MHAPQDWSAIRYITQAENDVFATGFLFEEAVHFESGKRGRQLGSRDKYDGHRVLLISMRTGN
jgi:hypothetical protein